MTTKRLFGIFASSYLLLSSVAAIGVQSGIVVRTIDKGAQSNIDTPRQTVARTAAEWTALWKAHDYDKPTPAVDFSREIVVAVFMGSRPTAGFAVEIASATERDGALVIGYRERVPAPGAITAQVLTSPYHIAAVSRRDGEVKFEKVEK